MTPEFEKLLLGWDKISLDESGDSIVGIGRNLTISYLNSGWFLFAKRNGALTEIQADWSLGRSLLDAISGPLRQYYEDRLLQALDAAQPWHHDYECSSPTEYRRFHSIAYPFPHRQGLLVVHSLTECRPFQQESLPLEPDASAYLDQHGNLHQCGHCRRVKRIQPKEQWDWIPAWIERCPANTSHGLCSLCLDFYYPPEG
jgi:hypothetical protein